MAPWDPGHHGYTSTLGRACSCSNGNSERVDVPLFISLDKRTEISITPLTSSTDAAMHPSFSTQTCMSKLRQTRAKGPDQLHSKETILTWRGGDDGLVSREVFIRRSLQRLTEDVADRDERSSNR